MTIILLVVVALLLLGLLNARHPARGRRSGPGGARMASFNVADLRHDSIALL